MNAVSKKKMWWPGYDIVMGIMWSVCAVWRVVETGGTAGIWTGVLFGGLALWSFVRAAIQLVQYYRKTPGKI